MKIALNWLKDFIDVEESPEELSDLLTQTGLEVEGMEKIEKIKGGLQGIVIGTVVSCKPHPNADKLKLTKVDVGQVELNIVCGAPNVEYGQRVIVAPPNTTIYPINGDPFTIKKTKIRGEISEGMICAEDEVGLGTDHDGILILDTDLPDGTPAVEYFRPEEDIVYEIGLTPNRGDAASHFGTARDVRAVTGRQLRYPDAGDFEIKSDHPIEVVIEDADGCPRFSGVTIRDLKVGPSPDWLQWRLRSIGLEPINNIVDITNYIAHGLGQPLHAYDADEIGGDKVVVKTLKKGSKFTTLDDKERTLHEKDLMICDASQGMCIAGVFGGAKSGIKDKTTNVFLESAYFSPDYIRNTVQRQSISTDASFRNERGTDPERTLDALKYATKLILEIAGGYVASDFIDIQAQKVEPYIVSTTFRNFHRLIGKKLENEQILSILQSLDIAAQEVTPDGFTAVVPAYRNDVNREADLVEEVLRIYGFNNIELSDRSSADYLAEFKEVEPHKIKERLSHFLAGRGYREMLNNSLIHPDYPGQFNTGGEPIEIINKSSEELAYLRTSPVQSGLEVIRHNVNRRNPNLRLFEFGRTYQKFGDRIVETEFLSVFLTGTTNAESWIHASNPVHLHHLNGAVRDVIGSEIFDSVQSKPIDGNDLLTYGLDMNVNKRRLARVGKIRNKVLNDFELDQEVFYAEVDWKYYLELCGKLNEIKALPKFPEVRRDLSLILDKEVSFADIERIAFRSAKNLLTRINVFSVYEGEQVGDGKKSYAVSFHLQDPSKTLTDKHIEKVMSGLMEKFEKETGARIRK